MCAGGECLLAAGLQTAMSLAEMKSEEERNKYVWSGADVGGHFVMPRSDIQIFFSHSPEDCDLRSTGFRENYHSKCAMLSTVVLGDLV